MGIRVFIGYGYNARDAWVETHVIPVVKALDCKVLHGRTAFGGPLPAEILRLIQDCDAMVGFTTRRGERVGVAADGHDQFATHPWVVQELTAALSQSPPLPCVEVREIGVIAPGGIVDAHGAQRIEYSEDSRADCLRDVAVAIARFRERATLTTVRLRPAEIADQIRLLIDHRTFECRYQLLRDERESPPLPTAVLPVQGSLFVKFRGLADGDLVRLTISAAGRTWRTDYESVDTVDLRLVE